MTRCSDGSVSYTIILGPASSGDAGYDGLDPSDITVENTDNEAAGFTVTPTGGLTTTESGGAATFTVALNTAPTADVTIGVSSSSHRRGCRLGHLADLHHGELELRTDGHRHRPR